MHRVNTGIPFGLGYESWGDWEEQHLWTAVLLILLARPVWGGAWRGVWEGVQ